MVRDTTLRKGILFFFLCFLTGATSFAQQVVLSDDFEDEDLTQNPEWSGDIADFTFVEESGNTLLQLDAPDADDPTVITTSSNTAYGTWEFFIDQDFSPSGSNRSYIFLVSDIANLEGNVNGYAIRAGESGSDDRFRLYRLTNGSSTEILAGSLDLSSGGPFQIRITRDDTGLWTFYESAGYGSTPNLAGSTTDNTFTTSNYFGFLLEYTSTRTDLSYFDDVILENSEPFDAVGANISSATEVNVTFNYQIDNSSLDPNDFSVGSGIGIPISVNQEDDFTVRLTFGDTIEDGNYTVTINNVDNIYGGTIPADTEAGFTVENVFDVVSVEVISSTSISIEFTEPPDEMSWNTTNFEIIEDGNPGSVVNPVSVDYDESSEPNTIYLVLGSPLAIGDYILSVENLRSTAGWLLVGDTEFDFSVVNPFFVTGFEYLNRNEFDITFSQEVDASSVSASDFEITGFGQPDIAERASPDQVRITYNNAIDVGARKLVINNLISNSGWEIEENTIVEFTLFDEYESGDLAISEFYYRVPTHWRTPEFNRPQYVEIYNRADKFLNLRNFTINGENISIDKDLPVSSGEYLVITRGVPIFENRFGERNFVEADEFPTLVLTTSDNIVLETNEGEEVESLTYDANVWGGNEVSLERFSFNIPASFRDNWAESEDILTGSPGLPNTIIEPYDPPEATGATFPAPQTLRITFSRTLSHETVDNLNNFSLDSGAVIHSVQFTSDERTLEFELNDVLEDHFEYTFSYQNIEDIFGNEVAGTPSFTFTFVNPFRILSAEMENDTNLLVRFTFPLQISTVQLTDFKLDDGTVPVSYEFANSETVRLVFGESFSTGSYKIVVNDLESLISGWEIEENSTFEFFRFDEYQDGDIVINEFLYNPPAGYPKYVELYNRSDRFLTMKGFELLRAEGSTSIGGSVTEFDQPIEPGGFIVITDDSELLEDVFNSGPWFQMAGFPGFTQTVADQIRLLDPDGDLVEAVDYDPSTWGGTDIALERRSLDAAANDINNWGESLDERLGTPGEENTVGPDDGPVLISATFIYAGTVLVNFSGSPDTGSILTDNFEINGGLSVTGVHFINSKQAELSLDGEMSSGQTYTITVTNIPDIFGNELDEDHASFTYYLVEAAGPGDIVINEFMYNEPDGYTEYVELYNVSTKVFNLAGWQQANDTGTRRVLTEEQIYFPPGSYMVILPNEELLEIFPDMDFINAGSSLPALKNSGDEIVITNAEGITLDSLRYSSEWGGSDVALERIEAGAVSSDRNNWGESLSVLKGTPGKSNSIDINTDGPELLDVDFIDAGSVRVQFSGALDREAISENNFEINHGLSVQEVTFTNSTEAVLFLSGEMESGSTYTITVKNISDIFGNKLNEGRASFTFYFIEIAGPGDVVINEIMYNPPDEYTRYIELYNRSNKAFDLAGWQQANDTVTRRILTNEQVILPPHSYIAVLPNFNLMTIFPDIPHFNAGTSLSSLKNGGDNIVITNAEGVIIDSLRYHPEWGGNGVALERRQSGQPSLYQENWGDSPAELFGTPGMPNQVESDFNFIVAEVRSLSPVMVRVEFNAAVRSDDMKVGNFSVNGVHPHFISPEAPNILILEFTENLERGRQTLVINEVTSAGGFSLSGNTRFEFTVFDTFSNGDILINEFMYRPPAEYTRYIELINTSSKLLNLRGWKLQRRNGSGESGTITSIGDLALDPGGYIVLSEDLNTLIKVFGERNFIELPDFPNFTTTVADQIRLFTSENLLADSLQYEPSAWGGNGVALERLSTGVDAAFAENWSESPNNLLGTPGLPNDAPPDSDPPEIIRAAQYQDEGFILTFNERLNSDQATDASNFSISPALPLSMIALDRNQVILFAGEDLINDREYEITVSGITDIFGNEFEPTTVSVLYLELGDAEPGQIVVNEIMYEPAKSSGAEFIEIFNPTEENFDLTGYFLANIFDVAEIPSGVSIQENGYLVFTDSEPFAAEAGNFIYLPGLPSFNNSADAVVLKNSSGIVIDSLFYRAEWGDDKAGISLERKDPSGLSFDSGNWTSSTAEKGSTPGQKNRRFEIDESAPEIVFANVIHSDSIEVLFDEYVILTNKNSQAQQTAKDGTFVQKQLQTEPRFLLNGSETRVLKYDESTGNQIVLDGSLASQGEKIILGIENLGDYKGNVAAQLEQSVAQPVSAGDIVFSEIMFDPITSNRDGLSDQSQYIEVYNRRSYAISLEGFFLHDEPDENGNISAIEPISTFAKWIPPNGYILIYPEPDDIRFMNSRTAEFFDLPDKIEKFAIQVNRTTLSLPNSGRQVYLADSTRQVIDMVNYIPEWHNPNIMDAKGISLERINPDAESNDGSNWGSNAEPRGGSPGMENSIHQQSDPSITGNGISFTPNPFSPDNDGYEDNLLINYSFDEPDYLLKVRIYDRYGRLVRKLAEAKQAGFEGTLVWDGRTDNGLQSRIGIYIILLEAYNSSNGRNLTFKETAVVARKF